MAHPYNEELQIGDRIDGRYEILAVVGKGSMGVVYKCRHDILGRIVAIKTLRLRENSSDDRSQKRFEREARLASRLDHPNLIGVHDFGSTAAGDPYLVMDFVSGQTLFEILRMERYLTAERAVYLFSQVCDGLFHAHERGVIHRDLKPANILVVKNENGPETVKIVDLGVAKIVQSEEAEDAEKITMAGEVCGSPIYLSPEQCLYQELDARTDIYSLGVCLYESLTGQPPLRGATVYDTIYMHVHDIPRPFNAIPNKNPDVPRKLEELVFRCLAKQANDRFETMMQVKQELISSLASLRGASSSVKVLPPESLFGKAQPQRKSAPEPLRPGRYLQPLVLGRQASESKATNQQEKRETASSSPPAYQNPAYLKPLNLQAGEAIYSAANERASKPENEVFLKRLALRKIVTLATCGSVVLGLSIGLGFTYFLSMVSQHNQPTAAKFKQLTSTEPRIASTSLQAVPELRGKKTEANSVSAISTPAKSTASKLAVETEAKLSKSKRAITKKKRKNNAVRVNTDLSKYLDDPPIRELQGSQSKYFSIVSNAPKTNMGMGTSSPATTYRSTQALQKLKNSSFIQKMKEFAASQGMSIPGVSPPSENQQASGIPFLQKIQGGVSHLQSSPAAEWRHGGSLLQQAESQHHEPNNNTEQSKTLFSQGTQLCQDKQFEASCQKLGAAHKLDPANQEIKQLYAYALNSHAIELNSQQHYAEAVECETKAVNLSPDKELYHRNLHKYSDNLEAQSGGNLP